MSTVLFTFCPSTPAGYPGIEAKKLYGQVAQVAGNRLADEVGFSTYGSSLRRFICPQCGGYIKEFCGNRAEANERAPILDEIHDSSS